MMIGMCPGIESVSSKYDRCRCSSSSLGSTSGTSCATSGSAHGGGGGSGSRDSKAAVSTSAGTGLCRRASKACAAWSSSADSLLLCGTSRWRAVAAAAPRAAAGRALAVVDSPLALLPAAPAAPAPAVFNPGRGKRGDAERDVAARTMGPPPLGVIAPGRGDTDRGVVFTGMVLMCVPRSSISLGVAIECGVERPMLLPTPPSAAWRANANSRSASRTSARAAAASASTKVRLGEALCADNCAEPRADCIGDSLRLVGGVARARSCCRCTCCDGG